MTSEQTAEQLKLAHEANRKGNYAEAEGIAKQLLAQTEANEEAHADALVVLAESARRQGAFDQAQFHTEAALLIADEHSYPIIKARAWNMLGSVYWNLGSYDKALEHFGKALALHEELGEKSGVALVTGNIGALYATQDFDDHDAASREIFSKSN